MAPFIANIFPVGFLRGNLAFFPFLSLALLSLTTLAKFDALRLRVYACTGAKIDDAYRVERLGYAALSADADLKVAKFLR